MLQIVELNSISSGYRMDPSQYIRDNDLQVRLLGDNFQLILLAMIEISHINNNPKFLNHLNIRISQFNSANNKFISNFKNYYNSQYRKIEDFFKLEYVNDYSRQVSSAFQQLYLNEFEIDTKQINDESIKQICDYFETQFFNFQIVDNNRIVHQSQSNQNIICLIKFQKNWYYIVSKINHPFPIEQMYFIENCICYTKKKQVCSHDDNCYKIQYECCILRFKDCHKCWKLIYKIKIIPQYNKLNKMEIEVGRYQQQQCVICKQSDGKIFQSKQQCKHEFCDECLQSKLRWDICFNCPIDQCKEFLTRHDFDNFRINYEFDNCATCLKKSRCISQKHFLCGHSGICFECWSMNLIQKCSQKGCDGQLDENDNIQYDKGYKQRNQNQFQEKQQNLPYSPRNKNIGKDKSMQQSDLQLSQSSQIKNYTKTEYIRCESCQHLNNIDFVKSIEYFKCSECHEFNCFEHKVLINVCYCFCINCYRQTQKHEIQKQIKICQNQKCIRFYCTDCRDMIKVQEEWQFSDSIDQHIQSYEHRRSKKPVYY